MADDSYYSSNKRKFDDQGVAHPPSTRRATGFSAPIVSPPPPPSATSQPHLELAKQKAQEIAARLFSSAEANRAKSENGDNSSYDYAQKPMGQSIQSQYGATPPSSIPTYGYQSSSKKIEIPNGRVGVIIGKGGETIKYLQATSGAKIQVTRDTDADPYSQTRLIEIIGSSEQVSRAEQLINDVLAEADAGGSGILAARKVGNAPYGAEQFVMKVPNNKVGLVIGKGGESIKNMQAKSGARIQVIPLHLPPGDTSLERTVQIDGTSEQIEAAKQLVNEVISGENRLRNQAMSGGFSQQSYQQPPRPPMWGPPGAAPQMQQPQQVNYNYAQQPYPQYGGYPSTYPDQSSNQTTQQTGYDYYSTPQQQLPVGASAAPSDSNNSYSYNTPQAYGDTSVYSQQAYAYPPPQDGTTTATQGSGTTQTPAAQQAPPAQQGYNGQQQSSATGGTYATQAVYYGQPPSQAGYGYGAPPPPPPHSSYGPGPGPGPAYGSAPTQSQVGYNTAYAQNTAAYSTDNAPSASPAVPKASPQS